jgi:periplasmic divalent cation tolerance protein
MGEIIVLMTAPKEEEAARIAKALVENKLAGCVNIIRNVRSIYRWQGKIEDDKEVLLIAKTRNSLFKRLAKKVKELHGYAVPEIISLPVVGGETDYLKWLRQATGSKV